MASAIEVAAMRRAVALSAGVGEDTHPNPNVGAVVLGTQGEVVGEGRHERAGGPHAEVGALRVAGGRARGGTAVLTLEPCARTGRTGPCATALLDAGIARVVYAVDDPTRAGGGAERLRAAGVEVEGGVLATEAEAANDRWLTIVREHRPFVVWKTATTLDGRVAAPDGSSRWISGPESRRDVARLRAVCDAVVAGVGTVLADDPRLTARDEHDRPLGRQPLRVVVDSDGRTPSTARVRDDSAPTWVASAGEVGRGPDGGVDLPALLKELWARDCSLVLLEGGPTLAGGFLRAGLIDRVVTYLAPTVLGDGRPAMTGSGATTLGDAIGFEVVDVTRVGDDVRITARRRREGVR